MSLTTAIPASDANTVYTVIDNLSRTWAFLCRFDPWFSFLLFIAASFAMIWRLGVLEGKGLSGTVLGTLVMPYASGFSNLIFAYVLGVSNGDGRLVLENCLVNNVTNLTLLIGLPALVWSMSVLPDKKRRGKYAGGPMRVHRLNRLSLLLTLVAVFFFTGALWALSRDDVLDFGDGLVLVGLFLFWQIFHIFDVLKHNVHRGKSLRWSMIWDVAFILIGGAGVLAAVDQLVAWIPRTGSGLLVIDNLGWFSGFLMVLPNGFLAVYYAMKKRADIVYSSQVGDGHICIPMCVGLFSLFAPISIPDAMPLGVCLILGASLVHFFFIALWGRLPRFVGLAMTASYVLFLYKGLIQ